MKRLYFSRFMPTWDLGGGSRRLMQMLGTLESLDCNLVTSARGDKSSVEQLTQIKEEAEQIARGNKQPDPGHLFWSPRHRPMVHRLAEISRHWSRTIPDLSDLDLVIMDDPIYFQPLFERFQQLGIPVIAISHNLETLVPSQVEQKDSEEALTRELDILSRCKLVITISQEESRLLTHRSIANFFFPYYPASPILNRLMTVREQRNKWKWRNKKGLLMIGSAINQSTREGMEIAAAKWHNSGYLKQVGELLVAGYKSETLFHPGQFATGVQFLGSLKNKELDNRLCRVKAALCYQEGGAGALTRICETLISGVPVLANRHAARSYHGTAGLTEFDIFPEPGQMADMIASQEMAFPPPGPPDKEALLLAITRSIS